MRSSPNVPLSELYDKGFVLISLLVLIAASGPVLAQETQRDGTHSLRRKTMLPKWTGQTLSEKRLKQLGFGFTLYTEIQHGRCPHMQTLRDAKADIGTYVSQSPMYGNMFVNPADGRPYKTNPTLSGRPWKDNSDLMRTVMFYEAAPIGGTRAFVSLDGQVHRVTEAEWQKIRHAQHLAR